MAERGTKLELLIAGFCLISVLAGKSLYAAEQVDNPSESSSSAANTNNQCESVLVQQAEDFQVQLTELAAQRQDLVKALSRAKYRNRALTRELRRAAIRHSSQLRLAVSNAG